MFIFRNTDEQVINIIDDLEKAVFNNDIDIKIIDDNLKKIFNLKKHIIQ